MCGIAGFCGLKEQSDLREATIRRMTELMLLRGPDAGGYAFYGDRDGETAAGWSATFGHRRLSIIDLTEGGAQPMVSHSGKLAIVYNGEIYNHKALARELERDGAVAPDAWRSTSDTEILLEAVEAYGIEEAVKRCRGMFAFAVLNRETGQIALARDRVGEKPLYYGFVRQRDGAGNADGRPVFAFASDIRCFKEIPGFANSIDRTVLPLYFIHGYIPAPYSIYSDIRKLEPGSILTIEAPYTYFDPSGELDEMQRTHFRAGDSVGDESHRYHVYWSMRQAALDGAAHPFTGSFEEASDELERILCEVLRDQMIADVPLGAFLSAGIDSSTIVSLMQKLARGDDGRVKTFTIGMKEEGFDEAPTAAEIAAHLGTEHTQKYITKEDALAVIPKLSEMFGEPFADSSQIPTYLVSAMTREHVTVSLSGDAGDELFCGYTSYASIDRIWGKMKSIPLPVRRFAGKIAALLPPVKKSEVLRTKALLLQAAGPVELHLLESLTEPDMGRIALPAGKGRAELPLAAVMGCPQKVPPYKMTQLPEGLLSECNRQVMLSDLLLYHPDDILVKVDRCAMANSLETRVPLLDHRVVEFALRLPMEYLIEYETKPDGSTERRGKRILRDVLYRHVPRELMDRPKKGFSIPIEQWLLKEPLRSWAEGLIAPARIRQEGLLDPETVEKLWTDYTEHGVWRVQIWYILMFEAWLSQT